jgi:hypothetical protein
MKNKEYIPYGDAKFLEWVKFLFQYVFANAARFRMMPPDAIINEYIESFETALAKCALPNHGKIDILEKKEARRIVEKFARETVQGFLARNPNVTDIDREKMRITVYDTEPTSVAVPVGLPAATFKFPNTGASEMSIGHTEGTPFDAKANYGTKAAYDLFHIDQPIPVHVDMLNKSIFTRRKKYLLTFDQADSGKRACFCLRYENSKGEAGQWGQIVTAIVP